MSNEAPAGHLTRPKRRPVGSRRYSLRTLGAALVIVLTVDVAAWLGAFALPVLGGLADFGSCVALVMFVVWFYRARVSADGHGWPQRQSPGWAIGAWFVPVINLWLPFRIMADIWRAGLPPQERANRAILPGIWWACFLACSSLQYVTVRPANHVWYADIPMFGKIAAALTAITTALIVQKVSFGPLGRKPMSDRDQAIAKALGQLGPPRQEQPEK